MAGTAFWVWTRYRIIGRRSGRFKICYRIDCGMGVKEGGGGFFEPFIKLGMLHVLLRSLGV